MMIVKLPPILRTELWARADERGDAETSYGRSLSDALNTGKLELSAADVSELRWNLQQMIEIADEHYYEPPYDVEARQARAVLKQLRVAA